MFLHHLEVELDQSVEDDLFVGQLGHLLYEVQQKFLQFCAVDDEEAEELIGFFEGGDGEGF